MCCIRRLKPDQDSITQAIVVESAHCLQILDTLLALAGLDGFDQFVEGLLRDLFCMVCFHCRSPVSSDQLSGLKFSRQTSIHISNNLVAPTTIRPK
jgi:hypothetical protein